MAAPEFTETFIIDGNWQRYSDFIHHLRGLVADPHAPLIRGLLQLPPENPDQAQSRLRWFAVVLHVGANRLTLRIRRENLYIDAYQTMDRVWHEYDSVHPRLFQDSVMLQSIDGSYRNLENDSAKRGDIGLTLHTFTDAVNELAHVVGLADESRRHQLVLIQMISESIRFQSITQFLVAEHATAEAPSWMIGRENSWGRLSALLLAIDADSSPTFDTTQELRDATDIWSVQDLISAVGIVKPPAGRQIGGTADSDDFGGGPKVEVFGVLINREVLNLCGVITGNDVFTHSFYDHEYEHLHEGEFLLLTDKIVEPVSACDAFIIDVDLYDHPYQIGKGTIQWNPYNLVSGKVYDTLIQQEYSGIENYSVFFQYVVFSDAVSATIDVKLIKGDGEKTAWVYGDISVVNDKFIQGECVLFRKKEQNSAIAVRPGEAIPLSRSIVAVSVNDNLNVCVNLLGYRPSSWDYQIAEGTPIFKTKRYGTDSLKIPGQLGEIEVKVTWRI